MTFRIWPSQKIRQAAADGVILAAITIEERQIQPASLDLRLGNCAYRVPASFLPGKARTVEERLATLATHQVDLSRPQVLERNCVHIIPLVERVKLPAGVSARANPKSSSGRLDIFVRLITDGGVAFDEIPDGYDGPLFAEVVPRSFPVICGVGAKLCQIRFREQADEPRAVPRTMAVSINLEPTEPGNVVAYRARRTSGLIDIDRIGAYRRSDFWEPIVLEPGQRELVLDPDDFYIMASLEDIAVSPDEASEMIAYDTSVGEVRVHYAGFIDPGFGAPDANGRGSKIVLEVRCHDVPFILEHAQRVGTLLFEKMTERPDVLYGQDLKSNYQGQGLKLSKHFR
ncbi:2'-deoxycytidine 5'-triphosphate deaminase [Rhodoblastus acidophilus]|uniref:2'-deoxycytidine 5'-triphosphate deaminase n=1 Tax=Candidatus Rhodoblastus alkanivorans TaxID=2954117 RepID=A0ABS9ZDS8_9HYPH|nr:2'-deoxycytidine 5'-triphosphate deaminase [Candidatus Rhodoblastus alkanivorans]MCI4677209.1 2'-deoxycytidine 5'-triphosphate deaminase [Candidatus Rhodoblastus alkanivorans]MCI4684562.1 2'-deoxycytidine 5'-triphosphate deaminase [Candidatus Rhodoblastus alkanivorans]MDI4641883.1 2'-deoxycytidine 5'-triphosphate deaminase [Rhodoblastus acidophilus]